LTTVFSLPAPLEGSEYYEKGPGLCIIINQKNFTRQDGWARLFSQPAENSAV
jgi:hypothetical protein